MNAELFGVSPFDAVRTNSAALSGCRIGRRIDVDGVVFRGGALVVVADHFSGGVMCKPSVHGKCW